jgi:hypothetical protein
MLAEAERFATLAAMGVDVYLLRTRGATAGAEQPGATASPPEIFATGAKAELPALVVACTRSAAADTHTPRLRTALPLALGIAAARIVWIEADVAGALAAPPAARAYLALGTDAARSLGEQLSTMRQNSSVIAVADAPRASLGNGLARRALWQALKPIARHLRGAG